MASDKMGSPTPEKRWQKGGETPNYGLKDPKIPFGGNCSAPAGNRPLPKGVGETGTEKNPS